MTDFQAARRAHAAAVRGYLNLDEPEVLCQVEELRKAIPTPALKRTGAWLFEGLRMCMFFACERRDEDAIADYNREIRDLANRRVGGPEGHTVIPRIAAVNWAQGWVQEVAGDHRGALALRQQACQLQKVRGRADALREQEKWFFGDKTEAILLVDLFTDMVRSLRMCREPIGSMGRIRDQLGSSLHDNEFMRLSEDSRMRFWSRRRAKMRVACEIADRQHTCTSDEEHKRRRDLRRKLMSSPELFDPSIVDQVDELDELGGPLRVELINVKDSPLAKLDTELFTMEHWLAWVGSWTDVDGTCQEECDRFRQLGFDRRADSLERHRALISQH